ncbi:MAG: ribosome silencing factor [Acidimicrobiia bacterium]|nr:ribosome silencing factor [Acidimicrobiia bacterium]
MSTNTTATEAEVDLATKAGVAAMARSAALAALDKQGRDAVIVDVGDVLAIVDYFVIVHGMSDRQVHAIVEEVERVLYDTYGVKPRLVEGGDALKWVLLDYGFLGVHVFDEETRRYYELERLWRDMPRLALTAD